MRIPGPTPAQDLTKTWLQRHRSPWSAWPGDADGYEKALARPYAWRWREWVIEALNRDMPFDEFTKLQLAADLFENPTRGQLATTGFHRNTLRNREGGTIYDQSRFEETLKNYIRK